MTRTISRFVCCWVPLVAATPVLWAAEISAVPGPDDQGGMLMPMVTITGADVPANPTSGTVAISFSPGSVPELRSLQDWSPGNWFAQSASWRPDIGSPQGAGGTPASNAGNGDLFNNQYGFMFMSNPGMGMAAVPAGKSLGIRLTAFSSGSMQSFNYGNASNRWDQVFPSVGTQVLWNGSMWHNYFTLPAATTSGTYTATFEVFVATTAFTGTTGFAQYDAAAASAAADGNFAPATVNYTWTVAPVPEPGTVALLAAAGIVGVVAVRRRRHA